MSNNLPPRTPDTMSDAIALSSPSGRMSKRARKAAEARLAKTLFGNWKPEPTPQPTQAESLLRRAAILRDLAARGMSTRAFNREADKLEKKAKDLQC
jgi:hypothetical protein